MATQKEIKALTTARIRARESEIDSFLLRLALVLGQATREIVRRIEAGSESVIDQIRLLSDFETVLRNAGLDDRLAGIRSVYATELKFILDDFDSFGIKREGFYSAVDREIVETLITTDLSKLETTIGRYGVDIKAQIARSVIAGELVQADSLIQTTLPQQLSWAKTELNTGMQAFNRSVTVKKAIDTFGQNPKFIYIGPDDGKTRPFCEGVLTQRTPPIYSLSEIESMNNDQISPVIAYGGGYNCRHQWRPVSEDLEKELQNEV